VNPREKLAMVSLSRFFIFFPPIRNVFSQVIFQLNCYFVAGVDCSPSVYKGNKSPLLQSPAHESQREAGDGEIVCFFIFFRPIPNVFAQVIFQLNSYFVVNIDGTSSVYKGNKSTSLPSPTRESQREAGDSDFVWFFHFFLPFGMFSHGVIFSIKLLFCCWC